MSEGVVVAVEGLSALRSLDAIPAAVKRAAILAVNKTADRAKAESARRIREQVAFPAHYLSGQNGRLAVTQKARATDAEIQATITGRFRATSLKEFARRGTPIGGKNGVRVEVAPGFAKLMKRAFLIRLRRGASELGNVGLAIRLRQGETIHNKKRVVQIKGNLYLLYGPSVNQVFRTVADDVSPETAEFLEKEFLRLLDVDLPA